MTETLELIRVEAEDKMGKAIKYLEYELSHLRAGRDTRCCLTVLP